MTLDELYEVIDYNTTTQSHRRHIRDAVQKFISSQNSGKPIVSGSLPLSKRFKAEWGKRRRLNWEHEYVEKSGCVNEKDCLKIVKALSGNDR